MYDTGTTVLLNPQGTPEEFIEFFAEWLNSPERRCYGKLQSVRIDTLRNLEHDRTVDEAGEVTMDDDDGLPHVGLSSLSATEELGELRREARVVLLRFGPVES